MKGESIDKTVSLLACGLCQAASYISETNINKNTIPAHNAGGMKRKNRRHGTRGAMRKCAHRYGVLCYRDWHTMFRALAYYPTGVRVVCYPRLGRMLRRWHDGQGTARAVPCQTTNRPRVRTKRSSAATYTLHGRASDVPEAVTKPGKESPDVEKPTWTAALKSVAARPTAL